MLANTVFVVMMPHFHSDWQFCSNSNIRMLQDASQSMLGLFHVRSPGNEIQCWPSWYYDNDTVTQQYIYEDFDMIGYEFEDDFDIINNENDIKRQENMYEEVDLIEFEFDEEIGYEFDDDIDILNHLNDTTMQTYTDEDIDLLGYDFDERHMDVDKK